jgi:hypothetical protein
MTTVRSDIKTDASVAEAQEPLANISAASLTPSDKPVSALTTTAQVGVSLQANFSQDLKQSFALHQTLVEKVISLIEKEDMFVDGMAIQTRSGMAHHGQYHTDHGFISPVDELFPDYNASSIEGSNLVAAKGPRDLEDVAQLIKNTVFNNKKPISVIVALGTNAVHPVDLQKKAKSHHGSAEDDHHLGSYDFVGYFLKDNSYKYKDDKEQPSQGYSLINFNAMMGADRSYYHVQVVKKVKYSESSQRYDYRGFPRENHELSSSLWLGLISPRKNGHLTKRPFVLQNTPGLNNQV